MDAGLCDPVSGVRADVAAIWLPPAETIPAAGEAVADADDDAHGAAAAARAAEGPAAAAAAAARALASLAGHAARPLADPLQAEQPHDAYFRVERVVAGAGRRASAYLAGVQQAIAIWHDEAMVGGGDGVDAAIVGTALAELWGAPFGIAPPLFRALALPPRRAGAEAAVRRWLRGHQVFAVLTQGLVWTLQRLHPALLAGDDERARDEMRRVARLYDASAAAFRFGADFDPLHYAATIRPSMAEPHAPSGFSGSLSPDHGRLIALLSAMKPALAAAAQRLPLESAALREALARLYDEHRLICERFAGERTPSLRSARGGGESAGDMLDRFKARRLANLT